MMRSENKPSSKGGLRAAWGVFTVAVLVLAGTMAHEMVEQRKVIEMSERGRLEAQAAVIHDYVAEKLAVVANTLQSANKHFAAVDRKHFSADLKVITSALGDTHGILIFDAHGAPFGPMSAELAAQESLRDQVFDRARRMGKPDVLVVSPPWHSADGRASMLLAVSRVDAKGQFDGVAAVVLDAMCCVRLLETLRFSPDHFSSIAHGDGYAFVFVPDRTELAGRNLDVPGSLFRRHKEGGTSVSFLTGMNQALQVEQMVVLRTVRPAGLELDRPLVVAVGRSIQAIDAPWWRDVQQDVALFALLFLSGAGGLLVLDRRRRIADARAREVEVDRVLAEERMVLAVEGASLGVWEISSEEGELVIDGGMAKLLGLDGPGKLTSGKWRTIVLPEDHAVFDAALDPPEGNTRDFGTIRVKLGDGAQAVLRILRVRSRRVEVGAGQSPRIVGTVQDVTEQVMATARLRASEARLKAMFEVLPVGITVTDSGGHIVDCNAASESLLGITREEHLKRDYDGKEWIIRYPDGRIMPSVDYASVSALRNRRAVYNQEMRVETSAGERWLSVSAIPVFRTDGEQSSGEMDIDGVIVAYVDVAEARKTELELRKLSRAVDQSGAAVLITDADGVIEYANETASTSYGYSAQELIGKTPRVFKSGLTPEATYRKLWSEIRVGRTWRGELTNRRRDGSLIHELVSISPVRDSFGRVTHYVAVREDISDRIANERLREDLVRRLGRVERMEVLGAMAGGVAHDFNNILVAILGFSGLGKMTLIASGGAPKLVSYFEEIEIAGNRARQLVQQLLAFSRGGANKVAQVDIAEAAHEAISLLGSSFPEDVRIVPDIEADLPQIDVDPSQLFRLFANPLRNARDSMEGGGEVRLSIRRAEIAEETHCDSCHGGFSGSFLVIVVADEGCGVPENLRSRIFEPFFTTWRVADGAGMGLAVVHGILHTYGGHVRVVPRPGGGTELQMFLPASMLRERLPEAQLVSGEEAASGDITGNAEDQADPPRLANPSNPALSS